MASVVPKTVARTRPIPLRKSLLLSSHQQLLSTSPLLLFLRPSDFTAHEWRTLRSSLSQLPPSPSTSTTPEAPIKLTHLRPGLLPALLRSHSPLPSSATSHLSSPSHLRGPLAVLTAPTFHPPTLLALLSLLQTASHTPSAKSADLPPPPKSGKGAKEEKKLERLELLSAVVDGERAFGAEEAKELAKLPGLDVLRAQIVGLLSAPGQRLAGVVGARANEVGRTLEGLREGLKPVEEVKA